MADAAAGKVEHAERVIPIRRVPLTDQMQLPLNYGATPGGTLFSTTPGGTRIIYDREFLMLCRQSPLTKTPPANLPHIPGVTQPVNNVSHHENLPLAEENEEQEVTVAEATVNQNKISDVTSDPQFAMDI